MQYKQWMELNGFSFDKFWAETPEYPNDATLEHGWESTGCPFHYIFQNIVTTGSFGRQFFSPILPVLTIPLSISLRIMNGCIVRLPCLSANHIRAFLIRTDYNNRTSRIVHTLPSRFWRKRPCFPFKLSESDFNGRFDSVLIALGFSRIVEKWINGFLKPWRFFIPKNHFKEL